jgi:LysR family transcriptional activator of dmlA
MYDPRDLFPFVEAARRGSFSAAARHLQVTPSAVSKSIARLEKALNVSLFNRSTRQFQLTVAGQQFYERLGVALQDIENALESLDEARQTPTGLVRLSTMVSFGKHFVLPLVTDFHARYPEVALEIQFDDGTPDLIRERFDLAIRRGPLREGRSVARLLCTLPLVLVASPGYLARRGIPQSPEDLTGHECISVRFPFGRHAKWSFRAATGPIERTYVHHPQGRLVVSEQPADTLVDAALMGAGVTAIAACFALPGLRSGALKLLLPDYLLDRDSEVFIQYPHREHLPLKVRVFSDFLLDRLRDDERLLCTVETLIPYSASGPRRKRKPTA